MRDIAENHIKQDSILVSILHSSQSLYPASTDIQRQFSETFRSKFKTVFQVMIPFKNRLPDSLFMVEHQTGIIVSLSEIRD